MENGGVFSRFIPKFDILFLSVKGTDAAELRRTDHPIGWLLTVLQKEHANKEEISEALVAAVRHIDTLDAEHIGQWRRAIFYLYLLIWHRRPTAEHDELKTLVHQEVQQSTHREEGEAMAQTMADYLFEQGQKQGQILGEKRGETRARREVLLRILRLKFEDIPEPIIKKVTAMRSLSRLDTLIEKAATTQTLDEIDWDNT